MAKTVAWTIQKAFLHAQRKATPPAAGTSKYEALLGIADSMQHMWQDEDGVDWNSLYSLETISTVTATDTFDLPDEVNYILKDEDSPILVTNGTSTTAYKLVTARQLYRNQDSDACAQIGRTLVFSRAFTSTSSQLGYSIKVPAILYTEDITSENDEVQVDDPMWLAYMMAAEFNRGDVVKRDTYDQLLALADACMVKMKNANQGSHELVTSGGWSAEGETW